MSSILGSGLASAIPYVAADTLITPEGDFPGSIPSLKPSRSELATVLKNADDSKNNADESALTQTRTFHSALRDDFSSLSLAAISPNQRIAALQDGIDSDNAVSLSASLATNASIIGPKTGPDTSDASTILAGYSVASLATTQDTNDAQSNFNKDLNDDEKILFEADVISRENNTSPVIAEGNVRAFFGERYLTAEKLIYYSDTKVVIAEGKVSITDENKQTVFAESVELSGDLRDGIAQNFTALLAENATIAAASATREQGARTTLNKVVYTACDVCKENGDKKKPTWRIKSLRVTRDEERRVIRFRHAFLELKGIPILYTPFLQGPDPSVERQSGFLTPLIGTSSRLSPFVEIPYFFALSNQQDFTLFPKITLDDGILWQGEWRRAGKKSFHVWAGGVIDFERPPQDAAGNLVNELGQSVDAANNIIPTDFQIETLSGLAPAGLFDGTNPEFISNDDNPTDQPIDGPGVRWYYFGRGYQQLTENLRFGYDVERVSDNAFLRFYDVQRRGDLRLEFDRSRTNRLRSNANLAWISGNTTISADSYLFQGLRTSDISSETPFVLPLINIRHDFDYKPLGGNLVVNANAVALQRTRGPDSRRFTGQAFWNREHITKGGHRFNAFAELRADGFFFRDLDEGGEDAIVPFSSVDVADNQLSPIEGDLIGRFAPTAGVQWSYPLARKFGSARLLLEPRVQLVASLENRNSGDIINEDSQSIEFDYAGLFDYNKSTGFDAVEDGQRINAGISAQLDFESGFKVEAAIGQQYRLQTTNAFEFTDGLGGTRSDLVGELNFDLGKSFRLTNRFRFDTGGNNNATLDESFDDDSNDNGFGRIESNLGFDFWRLEGNVGYTLLTDEQTSIGLESEEEINALVRFSLTPNWSIGAAWREDLRPDEIDTGDGTFAPREGTLRQDFLIGYKDECSSLDVIFRRDRTQDFGVPPNTSVLIRFTLRSLASSNSIRSRNN